MVIVHLPSLGVSTQYEVGHTVVFSTVDFKLDLGPVPTLICLCCVSAVVSLSLSLRSSIGGVAYVTVMLLWYISQSTYQFKL